MRCPAPTSRTLICARVVASSSDLTRPLGPRMAPCARGGKLVSYNKKRVGKLVCRDGGSKDEAHNEPCPDLQLADRSHAGVRVRARAPDLGGIKTDAMGAKARCEQACACVCACGARARAAARPNGDAARRGPRRGWERTPQPCVRRCQSRNPRPRPRRRPHRGRHPPRGEYYFKTSKVLVQ